MIFDRIMLPAQGRNEDYKFAQTGRVTLVASAGGGGSSTPAPSWLENVIKIDPESGFLSVDDWHVKGNLVLEGQVREWLAQQLVVDDARIQVNRKQDGAVADSGLVIFDKDTSSEVSSLVYDINGIWKAGGDRLFTEAYNPKLGGLPAADYALKTWVENSATAYNAARLGGQLASKYTRRDIAETITGDWTFNNKVTVRPLPSTDAVVLDLRTSGTAQEMDFSILLGRTYENRFFGIKAYSNAYFSGGGTRLEFTYNRTGDSRTLMGISQGGDFSVFKDGLFGGNLTAV